MKILLIAPFYDQQVSGESWSTFKWIEGISKNHDVTVLTTHKKAWVQSESPTSATKVVNWTDPTLPAFLARLNRELKPTYALFYLRARKWIKKALKSGEKFDLVHQINPLALRYPCPAQGLGLKFIMGPLAGSLSTPKGFANESSDKQWYRKLRNLDSFRIKHDPWLNKSYSEAQCIIGVAPYVSEIVKDANIKRFYVEGETGVTEVAHSKYSLPKAHEPLRLLFVGRIIRTKGVIDAVRAVAKATQSGANVTFDIVGEGEMLDDCKKQAQELNIEKLVTFHGRIPREDVGKWYENSHVFLFPSFREPSGNVVFEALGKGLPVITSTAGGPGYVVNNTCGVNIEPTTPNQYVDDLSNSILEIDNNRATLEKMSENAIDRISKLAQWENKIDSLDTLYRSL